jgi:hypothetical protein
MIMQTAPVGVGQMDAYQLLFTSEDDPEGPYGTEIMPSDFKYVGYRVFEPTKNTRGTPCDYVLEFSFTTWVSGSFLGQFNIVVCCNFLL